MPTCSCEAASEVRVRFRASKTVLILLTVQSGSSTASLLRLCSGICFVINCSPSLLLLVSRVGCVLGPRHLLGIFTLIFICHRINEE